MTDEVRHERADPTRYAVMIALAVSIDPRARWADALWALCPNSIRRKNQLRMMVKPPRIGGTHVPDLPSVEVEIKTDEDRR